ncbi:bifunctional glycosyltransferase/CDP-glycerol:glycerophosphate glycerophosphotransferase [[Enterobacter] lignolyticus]|uniref:Glycosyl transferase family 2 n=1 Tax=Enterobacter lignolyticus (strain SCF1) TaxID=701347 RepID=E3GAR8_ENTLS|nr:CDP-glycerol glycerophosphotransferase family protein [[Enterobacter] lignolyticus]ADO49979.1 glycosyl transferase family 2 [[Enterobacter] lignolyticus SCF1]
MSSDKGLAIITVIIPVYKVERYIRECLDSVLSQNLGRRYRRCYVEIICVDDGTPDSSVDIIIEYMRKNSNIILLQQINQGQSVARNNALKIAKGRYVVFLDSDDLFPPDALKSLLDTAERTHSEVIISHAKAFNGRRSWYIEPHAEVACAFLNQVKFTHRAILMNSSPPWGKMYSRKLILDNNIEFPVGIKLAEDWIFVIAAMYRANHISSTSEITYLYRGRDDEDNPSCTQLVNEKVFSDLLKVYELTKQFNLPMQQIDYAKMFILRSLLYRLSKFSIDNEIIYCKSIYHDIRKFLVDEIGKDKIKIFTPIRRLPLLLIFYGFYSEAHRVMNQKYDKSCLKKGELVDDDYISKDFKYLTEKMKRQASIALKLKRGKKILSRRAWQLKYKFACACSSLLYRRKNIALIGERLGNTANDSSYHLFNFIQDNWVSKKEIDYYYVIKKDASTAVNLNGRKNVVKYGSFKHFMIFHASRSYIFSDSMRDVFFHWRDVSSQHNYKRKYFLQHGVFATSRAAGYYDCNSMNLRDELPDKFIVSSDFEKDLVCKNFSFEKSRVAVTGLSRFDKLPKKPPVKAEKKILLFFTWRENLSNLNEVDFIKTEYYKKIFEILNSKAIADILKASGFQLEACLHHKMSSYLNALKSRCEHTIYNMNDVNVQNLLIDADIMITDFSSASFDMVYQKKPVIFYWFDELRFFAQRGGPLINIERDLPGEICRNINSLSSAIDGLIQSGCVIRREFREQYSKYFKYRDDKNCQRIMEIIEE